MKREIFVSYSENYKRIIFQVWYANGRPNIPDLRTLIPKDTNDRIPSVQIIKIWKRDDGWEAQADELDTKAIVLSDDFLIRQKSEMLIRHAGMAVEMQDYGLKHIKEFGFDSSSAAVNAMVRGAELERTSRGIGEMIVKMSKMTDEQLKDEILKRVQQASESGQMVLDAEEVTEDDLEE